MGPDASEWISEAADTQKAVSAISQIASLCSLVMTRSVNLSFPRYDLDLDQGPEDIDAASHDAKTQGSERHVEPAPA